MPTASTTSAAPSASHTAGCVVRAPSDSGCESGTAPLPFRVVTIGAPRRSATAIAASPAASAPPPRITNGVFASASAAAACATAAASATGRTPPPSSRSEPAAGRSSTSIGTPMCTGRGRRDAKISNARANASGSPAGSETAIDSAVMVRMNACWSGRSCSGPSMAAAIAGVRVGRDHEHRDRVVERAGDRRRGVRHAGAGDQHADTGLAGDARVGVGHEPRALLVPRRDMADRG